MPLGRRQVGHFGSTARLPDVTDLTLPDETSSAYLARLAASGDQAAFARPVGTHHAHMARVAYAITCDSESAADAVQVAWATALRKLASLRDGATVRSWLVAIAANEA